MTDYPTGRRDGMLEALAILAAEETKWADRLTRSRGKTHHAQRIRWQAFRTAQTRVQTALNKLQRRTARAEADIGAELRRLGI